MRNVGTFGVDANGKAASGLNHEGERTDATPRDGAPRSSEEVRESGWSEGGACSEAEFVGSTRNGRSLKDKAKPYYGGFNPSALRPIERHVGQSLVRWACRKHKKLRGYRVQARGWLVRLIERQPTLLLSGNESVARFSPYESRGSRTVLEGPRGEIPRGYLTPVRFRWMCCKQPSLPAASCRVFSIVKNSTE